MSRAHSVTSDRQRRHPGSRSVTDDKPLDRTTVNSWEDIGKRKAGKHFLREITDDSLACRRDQEKNAAEAALDGIYVIRTSVSADTLDSAGTITHIFLCMLAAYLTWHLRQAFAGLTFTDQDIPANDDPAAPARRSAGARGKDGAKHNSDKLPVRKYGDLLDHLSTLNRQTVNFGGQRVEKLTNPTPIQRRAFELLGAPVPLTLQ